MARNTGFETGRSAVVAGGMTQTDIDWHDPMHNTLIEPDRPHLYFGSARVLQMSENGPCQHIIADGGHVLEYLRQCHMQI